MEAVRPVGTTSERVPAQRRDPLEASLTQARVDALFRALAARREYERGVARLSGEPTPPAQREASD